MARTARLLPPPAADPTSPQRDEVGSAVVEFLGGSVLLLLPLLYLVLTLVHLQGAEFAASAAAREASRIIATHGPEATTLASRAVELAFSDQGLDVAGSQAMSIACDGQCGPGGHVLVSIAVDVPLPLAPTRMTAPVRAEAWTTVDRFRSQP